ncbi:MAG: hypothetical protein ACI9QV_000649 [Methylophagaceae bacterium]|jgi:uncharacterized protein
MKFSQEDPTDAILVKSYDERTITIQSGSPSELITLTTPFILRSDTLDLQTQLNAISDLTIDDVNYFKSHEIEVIILGQSVVTRVSPQILVQFANQAIGLEQMLIGAACRTYNLLVSEGRRVALVINF